MAVVAPSLTRKGCRARFDADNGQQKEAIPTPHCSEALRSVGRFLDLLFARLPCCHLSPATEGPGGSCQIAAQTYQNERVQTVEGRHRRYRNASEDDLKDEQ